MLLARALLALGRQHAQRPDEPHPRLGWPDDPLGELLRERIERAGEALAELGDLSGHDRVCDEALTRVPRSDDPHLWRYTAYSSLDRDIWTASNQVFVAMMRGDWATADELATNALAQTRNEATLTIFCFSGCRSNSNAIIIVCCRYWRESDQQLSGCICGQHDVRMPLVCCIEFNSRR